MKKIYFVALMLAFFGQIDAQTLNQPAAWPNAAWTITGEYNSDAAAFEANPTTTANFAYDDDDAGDSDHEDNIAAESPVINLTAAFAANEKALEVTAMYGYVYLENDALQLQYWDADNATWMPWGANIEGNDLDATGDFCSIIKELFVSETLDISAFTPTQLSGFKYRISYDDDPDGSDWNYGFCFDSPTIRSIACAAPSGLLVEDTTSESADISWNAVTGSAGYQVVLNEIEADPTAGTSTSDLSYSAGGLTPSTTYYFHIRNNCGSTFSVWRTISFRTSAVAPANDACADAIAVEGFPYTNSQDASAATNNDGYIGVCDNNMNDGVWYTFTGDGSEMEIKLTEVGDWDPQMDIYIGTCGSFSCMASSDGGSAGEDEELIFMTELGTTYYINVGYYDGTEDLAEGAFTLSLATFVPPVTPENDACENAIVIADFPYTNSQDATAATNNDGTIEVCDNAMNDGVWYTFAGNGSELQVKLSDVGDWDAQIDVYAGTCGSFTCVASSDGGSSGDDEEIVFVSEVGTTYYVNVGHYDGSEDQEEGTFTLSVATFIPPVVPENDACANATAITSYPYTNSQDATAATDNDGPIETECNFGMNDGVWYTFVGDGSDITVALTNVGDWDAQLDVYTGSCGQFTCVVSADDFGSEGDETVEVTATETGVTYFINVGYYSGSSDEPEGTFDISVTSSELATNSFMNANFRSYPNPVTDVLHVSYVKNISQVTVFNMLGQQVLAKTLNVTNGTIDLSALNSGTYIVKVASGKETKTIKVVKL